QVRHPPARQLVQLTSGDEHPATARAVLAQDETQEGGLAGAGGPDQEGELALLDLQVDIPQRGTSLALVRLGDLLESNHRLRQWPVSGQFGVPPRRATAFGRRSTA